MGESIEFHQIKTSKNYGIPFNIWLPLDAVDRLKSLHLLNFVTI